MGDFYEEGTKYMGEAVMVERAVPNTEGSLMQGKLALLPDGTVAKISPDDGVDRKSLDLLRLPGDPDAGQCVGKATADSVVYTAEFVSVQVYVAYLRTMLEGVPVSERRELFSELVKSWSLDEPMLRIVFYCLYFEPYQAA